MCAKLKEGILVGFQIRKLLKDDQFHQALSNIELAGWNSFKTLLSESVGSRKKKLTKNLVEHYCKNRLSHVLLNLIPLLTFNL